MRVGNLAEARQGVDIKTCQQDVIDIETYIENIAR